MNSIDYYTKNIEKIFNSINQPNWRIFKVVDEDGKVRQNQYQISTPEKLLRFIKTCKNPQKLYVSISTFLNPHRNHGFFANQRQGNDNYFYPRAGYIYADCILLDSFFFIDLDSEKDLRIAQDDARKIIKLLGKPDMLQFSGTKGIHLGYDEPRIEEEDPIKRVKKRKEYKEKIINLLKPLNLKTLDAHHWNILKDVFRVYAIPYSLKGENIVTPLDYNQFMKKDIYSLISKSTRAKKINECGAVAIEGKPDDKKVATLKVKSSTPNLLEQERDGLSSTPLYFKFADNMVNGLKDNYVTVIRKHKKDFKEKDINKLQRLYKLSDFYIVGVGDYIYAYNFKLQQYKRLVKIMRKAKADNLNYFIYKKHQYIPLSDMHSEDGITKVNNLAIIKSEYGLTDAHSRPHCNLFEVKYDNMAGNESNNIGTMRVR